MSLYTFEWLCSMAFRGALILALTLLLGRGCRRLSAANRYGLWLGALLATLLLPVSMLWGPIWRVLPPLQQETRLLPPPSPIETLTPPALLHPESLAIETNPTAPIALEGALPADKTVPAQPLKTKTHWDWRVLFWIWIAGVLFGFGRLIWNALRLNRLASRSPKLPASAQKSLEAAAATLGLRRLPQIVIGAPAAVPMVWGIWRSFLLLPEGFEAWDPTTLRAVLLHELAHLSRRDPLALWLAQISRLLRWFDPLAWTTLRRLRADQERACDDTVLRHGIRASDYASCLLRFSRQTSLAPNGCQGALAMARPGSAEERLIAILDPSLSRSRAFRGSWLAVTAIAFGLALPLAVLHAVERSKTRGSIVDRRGVILAQSTPDGKRTYSRGPLAAPIVGYTDAKGHGLLGIEQARHSELSQGHNVQLTLDAELQNFAEQQLATAGLQGAAVVVDLKTGGVLVMASSSNIDPNTGTATGEPHVTREYTPGSLLTLNTAMAAMRSGQDHAVFPCQDSLTVDGRVFRSWSRHDIGEFNLEEALNKSQYVFFFQMAIQLGLHPLAQMASHLGLGEPTGLPIPGGDKQGHFPAPDSSTRNSTNAHLANLAIGQGAVLMTPLQMAQMASVIATRGHSWKPVLFSNERAEKRPDLHLNNAQWDLIHRALQCRKDNPLNQAGYSSQISTAMKRGVSLNGSPDKNLELVIGFAPFENPVIAFAWVAEMDRKMTRAFQVMTLAKRMAERATRPPNP
jgi:beta-lactamase regulating signal transducer with metallopeptidase domain